MRFVIFEDDAVVALDIEMILKDRFPTAKILTWKDSVDAARTLLPPYEDTMFIVSQGDGFEAISVYCRDAAAHGASVVMLVMDEARDSGFTEVEKPFSARMLIDAVCRSLAWQHQKVT